jgi:hypothetical protein
VCRSGHCIASHFRIGDFVTVGGYGPFSVTRVDPDALSVTEEGLRPDRLYASGVIQEGALRFVRKMDPGEAAMILYYGDREPALAR